MRSEEIFKILQKQSLIFFKSRIHSYKYAPSHDTFNLGFSLLDPIQLELIFRDGIAEFCCKYSGLISIDRKEICGAQQYKKDSSFEALRIVSAWFHENGISIGQNVLEKRT